jgi:multisubunit Na+/H+ antiporter MnhG subunit
VSKRREEKLKLAANALNAAASSSFTVGVVGPLVAVFINLGDVATKVSSTALIVNAIIWLTAAAVLHWAAQKVLDRLDE